MSNFEKLFVHLYTKGIEYYKDSGATLRAIDDILALDEQTLYDNLHEAFNQANRVNLMKQYGVPLEIGADIPKDLPEDLLKRILGEAINKDKLKAVIKKQANRR